MSSGVFCEIVFADYASCTTPAGTEIAFHNCAWYNFPRCKLQLHRKGAGQLDRHMPDMSDECQMNARLIRQQAKNRVDTARTGVYNLEKSNFRRILHVKCYCNGEKCKVNIAGWTFSVRFSCIVLSEQQVPAAVVIQGRLYGRPVIFALQLLYIAVSVFIVS